MTESDARGWGDSGRRCTVDSHHICVCVCAYQLDVMNYYGSDCLKPIGTQHVGRTHLCYKYSIAARGQPRRRALYSVYL